jgi:protein-S-isoprenylcysteine O-methyltransferase Ste14
MQRSITNQRVVRPFIYVALFVFYSSLSSIYLFLPPLLGVLFVLFIRAQEREDILALVLICFSLLIFEANFGYLFFSSIFYFYVASKFLLPKIEQNFNCYSCVRIMYVLLAYIGYYLFLILLSKIFLLPLPHIDYYIVYYIVIEFFLVSLL